MKTTGTATENTSTGTVSINTLPEPRDFATFVQAVHDVMSGAAKEKGYGTNPNDPNPLFELTGMEHATGEIMYKAIRYRRKQDPADMVKAAAWAFLVWRHRP